MYTSEDHKLFPAYSAKKHEAKNGRGFSENTPCEKKRSDSASARTHIVHLSQARQRHRALRSLVPSADALAYLLWRVFVWWRVGAMCSKEPRGNAHTTIAGQLQLQRQNSPQLKAKCLSDVFLFLCQLKYRRWMQSAIRRASILRFPQNYARSFVTYLSAAKKPTIYRSIRRNECDGT